MVLFVVVNADYKFIITNVSCYVHLKNTGGCRISPLSTAFSLDENSLGVSEPRELDSGRKIPYIIVEDDAFPLKIKL